MFKIGIGKRIKEAREMQGLTQAQLAGKIGVTASAVTNYENSTSHPKEIILYNIMKQLNIDANFLFQDEVQVVSAQFSLEQQDFIKKYSSLDEHGKKMVDIVLNEEYNRTSNEIKLVSLLYFPKLINEISDNYSDFINLPIKRIHPKADYIAQVNSAEMNSQYSVGEKLFIQKCNNINIGETGLFLLDKSCLLRKSEKNNLLVTDSKEIDVITLTNNVVCVGKVLGKLE